MMLKKVNQIKRIKIDMEKTGRGLWMVMLLLAFCWSFYFQFSMVETGNMNIIDTNEKVIPIYSVETEEKVVSLTFDSAWNIDDLDEILAILEKNDIKATFFMTGDWVERYPEAVKKIYKAGHDLGNHGENHKNMSELSKEECITEIKSVHNRVYEIVGIEMDLFRPPSGDYDDEVVNTATELGYYTVQWDCDSLDWKNYGVSDMIDRVVNHKNLKNGSIILLHNGTKYTAEALQGLIDGLKNKGYGFVPISELIYRDGYSIDNNGRQQLEEETSK